jgi:hypothetical protein
MQGWWLTPSATTFLLRVQIVDLFCAFAVQHICHHPHTLIPLMVHGYVLCAVQAIRRFWTVPTVFGRVYGRVLISTQTFGDCAPN